MSDVAVASGTGVSTRRRPRRGRVLRGIGKTLLTMAVILAAYIVWLLWGTGFYYDSQQGNLRTEFEQRVEVAGPGGAAPAPVLPGQAYAILRIPDLELDEMIVEGTDVVSLKKGPGHYEDTAHPWNDSGRVGIAGHRTTYGAPFWDLDLLEPGADIQLVTERGTFDYVVRQTRVVLPDADEVLNGTRRPTLVLTTCNPKFSAAERLIVVADRVA